MSLDITLSDELAAYVSEKTENGGFESVDSFVEECLNAFRTHPLVSDEAEESIQRGYTQAKAGQYFQGTMNDIRKSARRKWQTKSES